MKIVYHTSLQIIESPDTKHSRPNLDFGIGFYVTSIENQARKYGERFVGRNKNVWMNVYELNEDWEKWHVKVFEGHSEEWLDFVTSCRLGKDTSNYDLVVGPVADDKVFETCDAYFSGLMSKEIALERLKFIRPNTQYCIRNNKMLKERLTYLKSIQL